MSLETLAATATESRGGWKLIKIENKYFLNVKYDNFLPINNNIESVGPDLSTFSGVMIYSRNRSIKYFVTKIPFTGNNSNQSKAQTGTKKYFYLERYIYVLCLEYHVQFRIKSHFAQIRHDNKSLKVSSPHQVSTIMGPSLKSQVAQSDIDTVL